MILDVNQTAYKSAVLAVSSQVSGQGKKAHVITFGCQQNEADGEKIAGILTEMGYEISNSYEGADVVIVNTCAIREHAEMKALSLIGRFKAEKRRNPDLILGVCGCMAAEAHRRDMLKNDFHYVTFTLEPNMLHKIPELVLASLTERRRSFILGEDKGDIAEGLPTVRKTPHRAWVSIMYGCNNFCTYCIVPYVRGRERSRSSRDVIEECKMLVASGIKEITLLGQNVNSYKAELSFAGLLREIAKIPGDFILRFMTSHPKDVSEELIEVIAEYTPKIAPSFHLPLQSGSDKILKSMNRTYTADKYLDTVATLRRAIPDIALTTDIIVGFPGESEEDFADTVRILEEVRFDMAYSFLYSKRRGTAAERLENHISREIKDERMAYLLELQGKISYEVNQPLVGNVERVLVDSKAKRGGTYSARTYSNKLVHLNCENEKIGRFIDVKITKAGAFDLFGEPIEK